MNTEYHYYLSTPNANATPPSFPFAMELDGLAPSVTPITVAHENFSFDSLMIHAWLSQLLEEAVGVYANRKHSRLNGMQTGQAQRGFLRIFGNPGDAELHRVIQNMYRFTSCDDPLAAILLRALDALSAEHDSADDFSGRRAPDFSEFSLRPRDATLWMRQSLDRWCEWVDAYIHLQTHSQWHLAPEFFNPDPEKRQQTASAMKQHRLEQFRTAISTNWQCNRSETTQFYRELPLWLILPQATLTEPQRPWPHPELDEALIVLWPLIKRHHWTYSDLLNVLGDLLDCSDNCICETERNLAIYCHNTLRLRKIGHGRPSKEGRPEGYVVAVKLVPPAAPPPILSFPSASCYPDSQIDELL